VSGSKIFLSAVLIILLSKGGKKRVKNSYNIPPLIFSVGAGGV
jgi:hypothetical protein